MNLPITGTVALLDILSDFVPDDHINQVLPRHRGVGRRCQWSAAQLYRVMLLLLLTPARSSNLLSTLLYEQKAWRRFARLPNRQLLPGARALHEFRERLTPMTLRAINERLVADILKTCDKQLPTIGLIDATDLPASTNPFKKRVTASIPPTKRLMADAPPSPAKAAGLLGTKSTPCVYGSRIIRRGCSWCLW